MYLLTATIEIVLIVGRFERIDSLPSPTDTRTTLSFERVPIAVDNITRAIVSIGNSPAKNNWLIYCIRITLYNHVRPSRTGQTLTMFA